MEECNIHIPEAAEIETSAEQSTAPMTESVQIIGKTVPKKAQHTDDVVLTQCILCALLVLVCFALRWLKPEWQTEILELYTHYRDAAPVAWLDSLLKSIQDWLKS